MNGVVVIASVMSIKNQRGNEGLRLWRVYPSYARSIVEAIRMLKSVMIVIVGDAVFTRWLVKMR